MTELRRKERLEKENINMRQQILEVLIDGNIKHISGNAYQNKRLLIAWVYAGCSVQVIGKLRHSGEYKEDKNG